MLGNEPIGNLSIHPSTHLLSCPLWTLMVLGCSDGAWVTVPPQNTHKHMPFTLTLTSRGNLVSNLAETGKNPHTHRTSMQTSTWKAHILALVSTMRPWKCFTSCIFCRMTFVFKSGLLQLHLWKSWWDVLSGKWLPSRIGYGAKRRYRGHFSHCNHVNYNTLKGYKVTFAQWWQKTFCFVSSKPKLCDMLPRLM